MESITKRYLTPEQLALAVGTSFGRGLEILSVQELTDGFFNAAYSMDIRDVGKTVLKVAPGPDVKVMRYEEDLMRAEAAVLRLIKEQTDAHVPRVLSYCDDKGVLGSEFLFLEHLAGSPMNKAFNGFTDGEKEGLNKRLGQELRSINSIRGDYFGCISVPGKRFGSWSEAFGSMTEDLMADARDAGVSLPIPETEFMALVGANGGILDSIVEPSLVHKDMWQGNVFVNPETLEITGIIDCERALFGDPLMDFVFGFLEDNSSFNEGYGRVQASSREEMVRKLLYAINLDLILIIECYYRKYPTNDQEKWGRDMLDTALKTLRAL